MPSVSSDYGQNSAKGPKQRKAEPRDLRIEFVRIEPADNGFTVTCHKAPTSEARHEAIIYSDPDRAVFETSEKMLAHISKLFK